jgi:NAD dependent epimerase/dehydratase family enzyme
MEFSKTLGKALHRPTILTAPPFALKALMGELSTLVLGSQKVTPKAASAQHFTFKFPTVALAFEDIVKKKPAANLNSSSGLPKDPTKSSPSSLTN